MERFDVWNTFPGAKIVEEEEYRWEERQIGVRDGAEGKEEGRGAAERVNGGRGDRAVEISSSSSLRIIERGRGRGSVERNQHSYEVRSQGHIVK